MILKKWENIPQEMRNDKVKRYYDALNKKSFSLFFKRIFDVLFSIILLIILSPVFLILIVVINLDSKGGAFFKQERVTQYNRVFKIYKFRTMVNNAESLGSKVTQKNDVRITKMGKLLRKCRLDEIPQLINILKGEMSFVGTRPEVVKYVDKYNEEMLASLLLPAGVTSSASIEYKDEDILLENCADVDETYVKEILPQKMRYNLAYLENYSFIKDLSIMLKTVGAVIK